MRYPVLSTMLYPSSHHLGTKLCSWNLLSWSLGRRAEGGEGQLCPQEYCHALRGSSMSFKNVHLLNILCRKKSRHENLLTRIHASKTPCFLFELCDGWCGRRYPINLFHNYKFLVKTLRAKRVSHKDSKSSQKTQIR